MGHTPGKQKRRASSARPRQTTSRSRSPEGVSRGVRAAAAERVSAAPVYVEPGTDGDSMGLEGRHRVNSKTVFQYLAQLASVVNDHADVLDNRDVTEELLRRRIEAQALEIASVKAIVSKADAEAKLAIEQNDAKLKETMEISFNGVWEFLTKNNAGIRQIFLEADENFGNLKKSFEDAKADEANRPSSVAAGPKGLPSWACELTSVSSRRRWRRRRRL